MRCDDCPDPDWCRSGGPCFIARSLANQIGRNPETKDVVMEEPKSEYDKSNYPPETMTGRGMFRLSWWNPTTLAAIEVWPDRADPSDPLEPIRHFIAKVNKPEKYPINGGARHGFRRRCSWCGVVLRGWQLNSCRTCKAAIGSVGLPGRGLGSAPCPHGSRWDAEPDRWRRKPKR
jgi:hypothetical protein